MKSFLSPWISAIDHVISVVMVLTCQIFSISSCNKCWFFTKSTFNWFQGYRLLRLIWGHMWSSFWVGVWVLNYTIFPFQWRGIEKSLLSDMTLRGRLDVGPSCTFMPYCRNWFGLIRELSIKDPIHSNSWKIKLNISLFSGDCHAVAKFAIGTFSVDSYPSRYGTTLNYFPV